MSYLLNFTPYLYSPQKTAKSAQTPLLRRLELKYDFKVVKSSQFVLSKYWHSIIFVTTLADEICLVPEVTLISQLNQ